MEGGIKVTAAFSDGGEYTKNGLSAKGRMERGGTGSQTIGGGNLQLLLD